MIKISEERNRLIKVRIYYQGTNQWRLVPRKDKKNRNINKGDITFRGDDKAFAKFLVTIKRN